jgi:hypothetical protein
MFLSQFKPKNYWAFRSCLFTLQIGSKHTTPFVHSVELIRSAIVTVPSRLDNNNIFRGCQRKFLVGIVPKAMGVWQGVAMDSLKYN